MAVIFVMKIHLSDGNIIKIGTDDIVMGGDTYDGTIMTKFSLSDVDKIIDVTSGGRWGGSASMSFMLPRDNDDSLTQHFMNSFYPSTSKPHLDSSIVDFGWTYVGASQVYWEHQFYVSDVTTTYDNISVTCYEASDLDRVEVPTFTLTNDSEAGFYEYGYYPTLDANNVGRYIPVIYGSFGTAYSKENSLAKELYGYVPVIMVDNLYGKFIVCSHAVAGSFMVSGTEMYRYLNGVDSYQKITVIESITQTNRVNGVNYTNYGMTYFQLIDPSLNYIRASGELYLPLDSEFEKRVIDASNIVDADPITYSTMSVGSSANLFLSMDNAPSKSDCGVFNRSSPSSVVSTYIGMEFSNVGVNSLYINAYLQPHADDTGTYTPNLYQKSTSVVATDTTIYTAKIPCRYYTPNSSPTDTPIELKDPSEIFQHGAYTYLTTVGQSAKIYRMYLHAQYMTIDIGTLLKIKILGKYYSV